MFNGRCAPLWPMFGCWQVFFSPHWPCNVSFSLIFLRPRGSRNGLVITVTWLRIGRPWNLGSTPVRCKKFLSAPKLPDRFWGPPSVPGEVAGFMLPPMGGGGGVKRLGHQADHHYLVPRFRMCWVIPLLCVMACTEHIYHYREHKATE